MFKKSVIVFLFFSILSCAANHPKQLNQLPSWYAVPQSSNANNLYGVGEGYTLAEASKSALNNLAGKLMTSISSESSMLMESNKYATNEQSHQKINEVVAKITFNNYQVSNSASFSNKIYVEISVNRDHFISEYRQKLFTLNQKMADIFKEAKDKTILEKLSGLESINNFSFEAIAISQILSSLNANNDLQNNLKLYQSYQNTYLNLSSKIEFFIENKNAPQALIDLLINNLNKKNLKVVKTKNLTNSNLVIVQTSCQITEQKIYGSNIAKLRCGFNLLSNQNKIIKSSSLESSGSSMISKQEAINSAIISIVDFNLF